MSVRLDQESLASGEIFFASTARELETLGTTAADFANNADQFAQGTVIDAYVAVKHAAEQAAAVQATLKEDLVRRVGTEPFASTSSITVAGERFGLRLTERLQTTLNQDAAKSRLEALDLLTDASVRVVTPNRPPADLYDTLLRFRDVLEARSLASLAGDFQRDILDALFTVTRDVDPTVVQAMVKAKRLPAAVAVELVDVRRSVALTEVEKPAASAAA